MLSRECLIQVFNFSVYYVIRNSHIVIGGLDEDQIRQYARHQLHKDKQAEQAKLWKD
jgi:hypothetical protein